MPILPVLASLQPSLFVSQQKYLKRSLLESSESQVMFVTQRQARSKFLSFLSGLIYLFSGHH